MDMWVDAISWGLLSLGALFILIGALGLIRLPDVFTRLHAAGVIDTLGAGLILAGLMVQSGLTLITVKLGLILVFILFTSPAASHALARTALYGGHDPVLDDPRPQGSDARETANKKET